MESEAFEQKPICLHDILSFKPTQMKDIKNDPETLD